MLRACSLENRLHIQRRKGNPHMIKWKVVCINKDQGGLGVRNLTVLNKALLGKWVWRFASDIDSMWKQVVSAKYGIEVHGWWSRGCLVWVFGRKF